MTETITVNPLIGTPLQIFGPLAETELEEFASSFNPPLDLGSILIALKDPGAGPMIMVMIENFMYVELDAILNKDQKTWTADETAFVNGFLDYINAQRAAAANKAMADYEAWAKATVAAEDAKIKQDTGQTQLMEIAALSANPPVPPGDFLDEASDGMVVSSSQAELMLAQMGATGTLVSVMNGTATATEMAYLSGQTFSVLGKGWTTFNGSLEQELGQVPVKLEDVLTKNGNINNAIYRKLPANVRQELLREFNVKGGFKNPDSTGTETETSTSTSTGSDAGKGASTATNTAKETETVLKDTTTAFDVVETVGRIASVAGVVGEAAAVIIQTITTATQYAEQASYNDAFSAAVNNALKPIGVSDLKAMMSSGKAMTYLMAEMAGGNPNAIDSSNILKTTKPDMPLSQILNIEKNF